MFQALATREAHGGSQYSNEEVATAALEYLFTGNVAKVSRSLGIPESTIRDWRDSDHG